MSDSADILLQQLGGVGSPPGEPGPPQETAQPKETIVIRKGPDNRNCWSVLGTAGSLAHAIG